MTSKRRRRPSSVLLLVLFATLLPARAAQPQGPQQVAFAGLRSSGQQGQFNAVATDPAGNLYLLLDQKDGVRLLKTDAGATTVLAQAQIGAAGDIGLAMALDPSGNIYVTGTSQSGSLTGTSGAAFTNPVDTTINSFVAKFDSSLTLKFATFGGSGRAAASAITATADAVFITGLIYGSGLPVTPAGIIQAPAYNSTQNGFIEKFSADGSTLLYATYLSGANGDTSPTVITADAQDDAYVAGFTTATGFPTIAALVPRAVGITSGFLTELTPLGDGITFSTFIPGAGISAIAIDPANNTLLLSGTIALGQFPVVSVATPLVNTPYQVLLRMALDGSAVLSSTVLAPGTQSFLTPGPNGTVWVDGTLTTPLLPLATVSNIGNGFALRVSPQGTQGNTVVDEALRFGGFAASNPNYASLPVNLTSLAVDATGSAVFAGGVAPTASASLLATQTFDLPLTNTPTSALPSAVHDAVLAPGSCDGSLCAGSAAYLARVTPVAAPSLALSTDASPLILLRNLGSVQATGVSITASGFTTNTNCGTSLSTGGECTIVLSGTGPGTLAVQAANALPQTASLAAVPSGTTASTLVFSPRELDFGVQTSTNAPLTRTITITNLGQQTQTFPSALNGRVGSTPYTFAETASDCTAAGLITSKQLDAGATCHVTLGLTASSDPTKDGPARANWMIAGGNVLLTGFAQAAALSVSASEVDFGTQFYGGLRSPRYLYISNNSSTAIAHTPVALPSGSAFTITDGCPTQLNPQSVCRIQLGYPSAQPTSTDSTVLALDQGLSVLVTGQTIPQPGTSGATAPPSLSVTPTTLSFANAVVVTGVSSSTQTVTIQNTGTSAFALALSLTGDFTDQTNCVASLAPGGTCTVILSFTPSAPGARQGLLGVTAGSGTAPVYVSLSGMGTPILPANNGTFDFGSVPVGQPIVQWYKVSQPFTTMTAATSSSAFQVLLVEDIGYGHGQPPSSSFLSATTGSCVNCWLGVQFTPPNAGAQTATLSLLSSTSGKAYNLALTGSGLATIGLVLSPLSQNFGPVAVNSSSAPQLFTLTNLNSGGAAVSVGSPVLTGNFSLAAQQSGGTPCAGTLAANASCFFQVVFTPASTGQLSGALTVQTGTGPVTATLSGYGAPDPGIAFNPNALVFNNVPDPSATQQTITVSNTGTSTVQVGTPTNANAAFQSTTTCATLAPAATCTLSVTYAPAAAAVVDSLQLPVTTIIGGTAIVTTYPIALSATYTSGTAGLQIVPGTLNFGFVAADTLGGTRQFTVNNLTAKALNLNVILPREFVPAGPPCTALAANGSCNFSLSFLPITAGNITGTINAQGTPTDGSAAVNGIGNLQGYGMGSSTLAVTGNIQPGGVVNFGQVASGQSAQQVLTLTNTSISTSVTIHRITSRWPFLSTTNCGATLAAAQSCTATLTYTPLNQVALGAASPPANTDGGTLLIESDAISSPDAINLAGTANPTAVSSPTNTAPVSSFVASQNALTFPTTVVGFSSAPQTVTLTNTGSTVLHVTGLAATSDYTVAGGCAAVLPAAACTLTVTFNPQISSQTSATRIGAIEITSDSSTSLEFLSLVGTSTPSALVFQPTSLNFGVKLLNSTTTLPIQITNAGAAPAVFNGITATGDYAASGNCPTGGGALAPNASCMVQVAFTPTVVGSRTGTLSIASSVSSLPLTANLSGTGALSYLQISSANLSFGSVAVGSSSRLSLTLANTGTAAISGLSLAATGDYAVSTPCSVTTLPGGASCSVTVTFTPSAAGSRTGALTIASSDPSSPNAIPLSGTGVLQTHLQLNASSLNFASVNLGATTSLPLTLTNTGTTAITGIAFAMTGDFAATPCAATTLAAGASCTATIAFTPTVAGTRTGTLTLTSSDPGSPLTVALSGTGTTAATGGSGSFSMSVDGGSASTQTVTASHPATYIVTVTPQNGFTGNVVLACSPVTAAPSATCSMLPSSVTLNGASQSVTVTINTLSSAANLPPASRTVDPISLCLLGPAGFLFWRFRKTLRRQRLSLLVAMLCTSVMLLVSGCGSSGTASLRISPAGSYQYSVVASSTGTTTPVSQTVMLNLVIQ